MAISQPSCLFSRWISLFHEAEELFVMGFSRGAKAVRVLLLLGHGDAFRLP